VDEIRGVRPVSDLIVILGPTASGKTRLAVEVAKHIDGAIISADSRQVYRGMDIGTGKDRHVYGDISHYLIDIVDAGETYHVARYWADFHAALAAIQQQGRQPIVCGGTGLYIQSILQPYNYSTVPVDTVLRQSLEPLSIDALKHELGALPIPTGFRPDTSTKKRLIRAIEIAVWCTKGEEIPMGPPPTPATLFGLAPPVDVRRRAITERLTERLGAGLIDEVRGLLEQGIPPDRLVYYGLEYKYTTLYLLGELKYEQFVDRLNTEIHRFAKRQMTYFRKMEKDGLDIHWLVNGPVSDMAAELIAKVRKKGVVN